VNAQYSTSAPILIFRPKRFSMAAVSALMAAMDNSREVSAMFAGSAFIWFY
jgi:hypothetical protein